MSNIDNYYRSAMTYTQSPPTTDTVSSSFNYSKVENQYGSDMLLYTGLIPSTNPLTSAGDGDTYSSGGIEIVEKIDGQVLTSVQESSFGFTDDRLTYLIPGSVYGITVWSKDALGDYTVVVPPQYYDVFFYPSTGTYVVYFKDTSYEPMYRTADGLVALQYPPAITCYRYCGPKGIENIPAGGGPQGPIGPQGSNGANGPQGAQGPTGAGSSGPAVLINYAPDPYGVDEFVNNTTTSIAIPYLGVTGLEPNYLYQAIFAFEQGGSSGTTYAFNYKWQICTAAGNTLNLNLGVAYEAALFPAISGGIVTDYYSPPAALGTRIFWAFNYNLTNSSANIGGFVIREPFATAISGGYTSYASFSIFFRTGSTADSRTIQAFGGVYTAESGAAFTIWTRSIQVIPIKSLA